MPNSRWPVGNVTTCGFNKVTLCVTWLSRETGAPSKPGACRSKRRPPPEFQQHPRHVDCVAELEPPAPRRHTIPIDARHRFVIPRQEVEAVLVMPNNSLRRAPLAKNEFSPRHRGDLPCIRPVHRFDVNTERDFVSRLTLTACGGPCVRN